MIKSEFLACNYCKIKDKTYLNNEEIEYYCYNCRLFLLNPLFKKNILISNFTNFNLKEQLKMFKINKDKIKNNTSIYICLLVDNFDFYSINYKKLKGIFKIFKNDKECILNKYLYAEININEPIDLNLLIFNRLYKKKINANLKIKIHISIGNSNQFDNLSKIKKYNKNYLKNILKENETINLDLEYFNNNFIKIWFNGVKCDHQIPNNFENFFVNNFNDNYHLRDWECKICNKFIFFKDIMIYEDFKKYILYYEKRKVLKHEADKIYINKDKIFTDKFIKELNTEENKKDINIESNSNKLDEINNITNINIPNINNDSNKENLSNNKDFTNCKSFISSNNILKNNENNENKNSTNWLLNKKNNIILLKYPLLDKISLNKKEEYNILNNMNNIYFKNKFDIDNLETNSELISKKITKKKFTEKKIIEKKINNNINKNTNKKEIIPKQVKNKVIMSWFEERNLLNNYDFIYDEKNNTYKGKYDGYFDEQFII